MKKYIIGIDEVGRGALAGPITVGAVLIRTNHLNISSAYRSLGRLKDSKRLSAKQREAWFRYFKGHPMVEFAIARVYPRQIEKMNISRAANLAAHRAYKRLVAGCRSAAARSPIFLDGGLFLGNGGQPKNAKTVIKGDEKIRAVAIASIVAKVSRDRSMHCLAAKYPAYGLGAHKGYGTKAHYKALKRHGPSEIHRMTFL